MDTMLGKLASALRGMGGAVQDPQFRSDVMGRLAGALRGGVADVFPTGAGPIVSRNMGVPADPNYRNKLADIGLAGLTVYHGSPYKFDKFDMSKVGTGEGAQAYGHGLYLAENPKVAQDYAVTLSAKQGNVGGSLGDRPIYNAYKALEDKANRLPPKQAQPLYNQMDLLERLGQNELPSDVLKYARESYGATSPEVAWLTNNVLPKYKGAGNLYKVDLPDDKIAKMLDWDAPLSKQPEVLKALENDPLFGKGSSGWRGAPDGLWEYNMGRRTGEDLYRDIRFGADQRKAAEYFRSAGIPGIRYLDQGSRSTGKGTSNFVVFSDDIPKIIGRE